MSIDSTGMIGLVPEMTYTVRTTQPLQPTDGSPWGARQYWQVSAATLRGDRVDARLAATGGDWMWMSPDGFWRPDVRAQFVTDDGAVLLMHYTGLVQQTATFHEAAEADRPTDWDDQYLRLAIQFDTGADRYRWLTSSLFVAAGRLLGTGHLEYAVHRVT
ncbi:MAG TPA: DUF3237 domain-containing protein [Pseudonocardiaceae bacterium]|jgi:hypothetical protein|nr:DUF3237 domain-containing protein [Pseudonocardiaceae bacterium]